ncbi:MAG: hypothetical protein FJ286_02475 [Planctomycetes bacterium]|nr:hypothetical protein [Planctomycetota bacterium]
MKPNTGTIGYRLAVVAAALTAVPAAAETILVISDLQLAGSPAGQLTQPGWFGQNVIKLSGTTTLALNPTASGSAAGITAALVAGGNWESRGGSAEGRDLVAGTSFNDVVSDLWVTRTMSFTAMLSGLATGQTHRIRTWHNDSYNINQGFAAGGGTVQLSATGATIVTTANGTVTNLRGSQSDSNFGIASLTFIPTVANPQIGFTRVGGSITALPVNGMELTAVAVPEPAPLVVSIGGLAFIAFTRIVRRRGAAGN